MAVTISKIAEAAIDTLFEDNAGLFTSHPKASYVNALQIAINGLVQTQVALSTVKPDYEDVMLQLQQSLSENDVWRDIIITGTGQTLTRWIASGISNNQFSIERAVQEAQLHAATSPNSIMAATRMLGVRPTRKKPAQATVTLTRQDLSTIYTVPKYSTFAINNLPFFNRTKIVFLENQTSVSALLRQGEIKTVEITSTGEPFQSFVIGDADTLIANDDIVVKVDGVEWERNIQGPWTLGNYDNTYYETTDVRGDLEIHFGNGEYGAIPTASSTISIQYVKTQGTAAQTAVSDLDVTWVDMPSTIFITGVSDTGIENGSDQRDTNFYAKMAPHLRAANNRAVRRSDYRALAAANYPQIKDALFRGQAELAPGRRSMMNVIGVTLLTDTVWGATKFETWGTEFKERFGIYQCEFLQLNPTATVMDIKATVYCRQDAQLEEIKSRLTEMLDDFFEPKLGSLGYSVFRTDVSDILNGRDKNAPDEELERQISYVVLDDVTVDVEVGATGYVSLGTLTLDVQYTSRGGFTGRLDVQPLEISE